MFHVFSFEAWCQVPADLADISLLLCNASPFVAPPSFFFLLMDFFFAAGTNNISISKNRTDLHITCTFMIIPFAIVPFYHSHRSLYQHIIYFMLLAQSSVKLQLFSTLSSSLPAFTFFQSMTHTCLTPKAHILTTLHDASGSPVWQRTHMKRCLFLVKRSNQDETKPPPP